MHKQFNKPSSLLFWAALLLPLLSLVCPFHPLPPVLISYYQSMKYDNDSVQHFDFPCSNQKTWRFGKHLHRWRIYWLINDYSVNSVYTFCIFLVQCVFTFNSFQHGDKIRTISHPEFLTNSGGRVHTTILDETPVNLMTFTNEICRS